MNNSSTRGPQSYEVVGVMPPGFQCLGAQVEVWLPARLDPSVDYRKTAGRYMYSVARLKPTVSLERAQGEMTAIASALEREYPEFDKNWTALVVPLEEV